MIRSAAQYALGALLGVVFATGVIRLGEQLVERVRGPRVDVCEAAHVEEAGIERGNATWPVWRLVCDRWAE